MATKLATQAKFKSDAFEAIHTSASALLKIGAISKTTMRSFDESCLVQPTEIKPQQIKKLRETHYVSQPVFASYLNTSPSTVQNGKPAPSAPAVWRSNCWQWCKSMGYKCWLDSLLIQ